MHEQSGQDGAAPQDDTGAEMAMPEPSETGASTLRQNLAYAGGYLALVAVMAAVGFLTHDGTSGLGDDIWLYIAAGFAAQIIDGAMGMAYGVTASSLLLSMGLPPAVVSSTVHAAECFTTGASALSHRRFGNVDFTLFRRLVLPGVIGAAAGAYILSSLPGDAIKPYITVYLLLMGALILWKAFQRIRFRKVTTHIAPLGFFGALADAIGGGGWGPIVTTNLLVRGNVPAKTVGSVNAAEFFVTMSASLVFLLTLGLSNWTVILGLALGGMVAAPLAAWTCRIIPARPLMVMVGTLVIAISLFNLWKMLA